MPPGVARRGQSHGYSIPSFTSGPRVSMRKSGSAGGNAREFWSIGVIDACRSRLRRHRQSPIGWSPPAMSFRPLFPSSPGFDGKAMQETCPLWGHRKRCGRSNSGAVRRRRPSSRLTNLDTPRSSQLTRAAEKLPTLHEWWRFESPEATPVGRSLELRTFRISGVPIAPGICNG